MNYEHRMVEAAIDSTVNAIIIINEHGIIQRVNPATERIFGFTHDELIAQNVQMLMPADLRSAHDGYLRNYLQTGEKKIIGIGRDVRGRKKDGTIFPIHLSVGEFLSDGERFFVGTIHDISDRISAERESARQKTLFEAIFKHSPDAMIISSDGSSITVCNPTATRIFGYEEAEMVGMPCRAIFASDEDHRQFDEIQSAATHWDHPEEKVITFARKNGEHFPGIAGTAEITGSDGIRMGMLCVLRDVSREMAQDQALRQIQRMEALGQLTGGIAHDFNNLLTIITGNLELLEFELKDDYQRDLLGRATDAALMGARLTDRLLTFARRRPLHAVRIDLNEQLISMMDMLRRTLGETVSLASSLAPDLWPVHSDVSEIENAILNLAINARDAMTSGGQLLIETRNVSLRDSEPSSELGLPLGDYVRLSVSDTGHGIAPDVLSRVFEPFFTTKESGRGTGLGLSVIYGFAKQSGGKATIYSEPGHGTTVNLYLPKAGAQSGKRGDSEPSALPVARPGETILVVEDQAPVREITMKRLERLGYLVCEAESAVEAIKLLETGKAVDLIFSDVVMPGGMTGFDLADWAATNRPDTPIMLTSGFADNVTQEMSATTAKPTILRKPYSGDELAAAIRDALDGGA